MPCWHQLFHQYMGIFTTPYNLQSVSTFTSSEKQDKPTGTKIITYKVTIMSNLRFSTSRAIWSVAPVCWRNSLTRCSRSLKVGNGMVNHYLSCWSIFQLKGKKIKTVHLASCSCWDCQVPCIWDCAMVNSFSTTTYLPTQKLCTTL